MPAKPARNIRRRRRDQLIAWASPVLAGLQTAPYLTLIATVGGVVAVLILALRMTALASAPESLYLQSGLAQSSTQVQHFVHGYVSQLMSAGMWLLAPAFGLALLRGKGHEKVLPITLASVAIFIFWLQDDLYRNYAAATASKLGEDLSLPAYYLKLVVTSVALLSPPVMAWLYYRATIFDLHVLRSFLIPFALCFFGLVAIRVLFDFFDNGKDFMEARFSGAQIATFYLIQIPKFVVEIIDISLLLSLLYSVTRMSRYNEIIAMLSAGRSVNRILLPLFLVGIFASLFTMACNYQWAPEADRKTSDLLRLAEEADPERKARKARAGGSRVAAINRIDRRFWFLNEVPIDLDDDNKIDHVEIHEHDNTGRLVRSLYAKAANWQAQTPPAWIFHNVREMLHSENPEFSEDRRHVRLVIRGWRETPWRLLSESAKMPAHFLTVPQLASYLRTNHEFPESRLASYRTWWHERLARPLRCLVVVLFAAPLGILYARKSLMGSVASSMILYFSMYFLTSIFVRLGETHKLPAVVAGWSVNIIFGTVGAILLWQRSHNRIFLDTLNRLMFWKKA
ncbi:MAG: LptF/LptG family permease [Verrucomicrobiales bacterium]